MSFGQQTKPPYKYDPTKIVTLPSGLQYVIVEEGTGPMPKVGDVIDADYHGIVNDTTIFDSSFDRGKSFQTLIGVGMVIKGWDEGFQLFKAGTKAVLICPPHIAYGSQARGKIPANSTLYFHVKLNKVKTIVVDQKPPYKYDESKAITTPSGLKICIVEEGKGAVPQRGQMIVAHYHGLLQDGTIFDSSFDRGQAFMTPIGVNRVIRGWDEAFTSMKAGTKAVLIVPPNLGYGAEGSGPIPGNSTIYFHVQLFEAY